MVSERETVATGGTSAWSRRRELAAGRALAARQRELAAATRAEAAASREEAARMRAVAAQVRDEGARARDDAARVRDGAAKVRDEAARSRDRASRTRDEAVRKRLEALPLDRDTWAECLDLDRVATQQSREAADGDREAARLDRIAAEKDRDAADRDRAAASSDRAAADRDREAADKDRDAADADRAAADIDRNHTDQELALAEDRLSKSDRVASMGHLAAGLAHELNNPLAALMATLATATNRVANVTACAELVGPLLQDANLCAQRMAQVLADMKAWLYEGDELPARQLVDVAHLVESSVRVAGIERVARVVVDLRPTPPVWGVASRLEQVVTNLLLNAAHAVSGPRERNEIRVSARGTGATIHLEVSDTGGGIAPDVLPYIFDPFFTTREGTGGTGLGLAMCARIVSQHGGTISVESQVGRGSVFRIDLPAGSESGLHAAPLTSQPALRPKVLLIDDDPGFTRSMAQLLSDHCDVTVASNGREGLDRLLAPAAHYDVVLCDLMMPVMNGLDLYRKLSELRPELAAEVIFISGGATTAATAEFLAGLPNVQLQKPFGIPRLLALIEERSPRPAPAPSTSR